jgi:2,4-diketo-3-deoxy-L-fuconate hydrolase
MRICRFDENRIGLVAGNHVHDVSAVVDLSAKWPMPQGDLFIRDLDLLVPRMQVEAQRARPVPLSAVKLLSPIANPSKIIGAPANYHRHIAEANADNQINAGTTIKPIDHYGLFLKANSSLIGPSETICVPDDGRRVDHEIELVAVVGRKCRNVPEDQALSMIAGYAIGNDATVRGTQDRSFRKSADTFSVLGPWMVTADEIDDPDNLDFSLSVNGVVRQQANTRDLIFGVAKLLALASSCYTLFPGDLIYTGTPEGVGSIAPGDRIDLEIASLGHFHSNVVAEERTQTPALAGA